MVRVGARALSYLCGCALLVLGIGAIALREPSGGVGVWILAGALLALLAGRAGLDVGLVGDRLPAHRAKLSRTSAATE